MFFSYPFKTPIKTGLQEDLRKSKWDIFLKKKGHISERKTF